MAAKQQYCTNIYFLTTGHFCSKQGHAVLLFPLYCPHIVKWYPSLRNLAANTVNLKSA